MIPPTLYGRLLGSDYAKLPHRVALLHAREGARRYTGVVRVERGRGWLSRWCAAVTRLPPAGEGRIVVDIRADAVGERWTRRFGGRAMPSRLRDHGRHLRERLGPVTFDFRLAVDDARLHWAVDAVRVLGIPLPKRWFDGVRAVEFDADGRYRFDVRASLPVAGLLVHYCGWLDVD